ncbi:MAG: pyridoxamine 5'-phosphate oxidase family protein [Caldilineaceae bacterium]|nr:pyridoxamine 5'-phosphate oxidase family protein [Caldilineaceae bacterium]
MMEPKNNQNGAHNVDHHAIEKLGELIDDIHVAMLTTVDEDGTLRSRPMATQEVEFEGDLWFFTSVDDAKVDEVRQEQQVNVSYVEPKNERYISVSGQAQVVRDPETLKALWHQNFKAWFPDGLDDPTLALLKIRVEKAEYWESSDKVVKALVTGPPPQYQGTDHAEIDIAPVPSHG